MCGPALLGFYFGASGRPFDERLCGNAEALMQSPDHLERKWPSAIEHFVHTVSAADEGNEIAGPKPVLVHVIFDSFHRVGEIERIGVATIRRAELADGETSMQA